MQEIKCNETLYIAEDNKIFICKDECVQYEKRERLARRNGILFMIIGFILALCWCSYEYNLLKNKLTSIASEPIHTKIYLKENEKNEKSN